MTEIMIQTHSKDEMIDITALVQEQLQSSGIKNGLCFVYTPHTTAGLTINENADPSVRQDILMALRSLVPDHLKYAHAEGNSPAHVKASLTGSSVLLILQKGQLKLGTWQGIFFCEFDGPRTRKVFIEVQEKSSPPQISQDY